MKRKVIFIIDQKDVGCAMIEALEHSTFGVYGIVNFYGHKSAIIKRGNELVTTVPQGVL